MSKPPGSPPPSLTLIPGGGGEERDDLSEAAELRAAIISQALDTAFLQHSRLNPEELAQVRELLRDPAFQEVSTLFGNECAMGTVRNASHILTNDLNIPAREIELMIDVDRGLDCVLPSLAGEMEEEEEKEEAKWIVGDYLIDAALPFVLVALKKAIDGGACSVETAKEHLAQLYALCCFSHAITYGEITREDLGEDGFREAYGSLDAVMQRQVDTYLSHKEEDEKPLEAEKRDALLALLERVAQEEADKKLPGADLVFVERRVKESVAGMLGILETQAEIGEEITHNARHALKSGGYKRVIDRLVTELTIHEVES